MEQVHAREDLLPGAARPALLVRLGGRDSVGAQLGRGQDPALRVGQVVEGAGESGVLWFMKRGFPRPIRPLTAVTRPSTIRDKVTLKYGRSTAERGWSGGETVRVTALDACIS
ncbi:hypothetical protein SAV31267_037140 [Streptomyces avermitilis]|uniref:Uncharacterized protein n=1 Tax=Streptomyces avermitilis TaxID=33903 RepID=A0A4D4MS67_STRAX|nr:hypothetical protein SAV31267_037140 [Streptomyces avermitilis]